MALKVAYNDHVFVIGVTLKKLIIDARLPWLLLISSSMLSVGS